MKHAAPKLNPTKHNMNGGPSDLCSILFHVSNYLEDHHLIKNSENNIHKCF